MSLTGYTDAQAKRADIAAQIVGLLRGAIANYNLAYDLQKPALALIAAYEATFEPQDKEAA